MEFRDTLKTKLTRDRASRKIKDFDLICFSHLRWNFVYQRPQHLLSRFAAQQRVFFIEEPILHGELSRLHLEEGENGVQIVVPLLDQSLPEAHHATVIRALLNDLFKTRQIENYLLWYYTPIGLDYTRDLKPELIVYDCMDELSAFKNPPVNLRKNESKLLQITNIVFTGGQSIYEAKKGQNPNVHLFPSSIDRKHFGLARQSHPDPVDQKKIPHPRLGYFGVIDERMDLDLLSELADARPNWHIILLGPVVKIDPLALPRRPNIHYIGMKAYSDLPTYLSGWDIALIPFAMNEATRFISPTKTPEYLAGGIPVVSTPIKDVIHPYGELGLAYIATGCNDFITAVDKALKRSKTEHDEWLQRVDAFLARTSWDQTWSAMLDAMETALRER